MTESYSIEIDIIRSFAQGDLSVREFEQALYFNPEMENFLSSINSHLPSPSGDSIYLRLISLNYYNDEDVASAQTLSCETIKVIDKLIFDRIIQNLEKWSQEQNLIKQTFESCQIFLQNCAAEDAELFPPENDVVDGVQRQRWKLSEIKVLLYKQSLVFKHSLLSYYYIDTSLNLHLNNPENSHMLNLKQIGSYRLIVKIDGEIVDDYLEIYDDCLLVNDMLCE